MTTTKPIRKSGITVKDIGGEIFLHDNEGKAIHVLNSTAQLIWDLCDGQHTPAEMETVIRERFAVPDGHDVMRDINQTLKTFVAKGILQD
jgi:hypothetical protein